MKLAIFLALVVSTLQVPAQEPVDLEMVARIRAEGLQRSQVVEIYNHFANVIGPRLTSSPAFNEAAGWTRDRLSEWGIEDVHLEAFEFGRGWTLERFSVEMTAPRYFPLIGYPRAWSTSTKGVVVGTPILTAGRSAEELEGKLAGAIVLTRPIQTSFIREDRQRPSHDPEESIAVEAAARPGARGRGQRGGRRGGRRGGQRGGQRGRGVNAAMLQREGAGVTLEPSRAEHGTLFVTGRDGGNEAVPGVVLIAEHYNLIARLVEQGVPVEMEVNVQGRFHEEDLNGYNIIGEIPGVDSEIGDEVVMVGAHLDSWHSATGATDNADGCAVAMEAMRILTVLEVQPRRTIRIGIWGGEEQGLHGSRHYVEDHLSGEQGQAARDKFSVYFNLDPGYGAIQGWFLEGNAAMYPIMQAYSEPFADLGADTLTMRGIGSTDHLNFIRVGLPGFQAIHSYVDYDVRTHHTNMDTYERIAEDDLKQASVVMASILYHAAMRDEKMPRAPRVGRLP
jgi:hypothetical protein